MKRTTFTLAATAMLILPLLGGPSPAFAADDRHAAAIDRALETSSLAKAEQAEVHAGAAAALSAGVPPEDVEIIVTRATGRGLDAGSINRLLDIGATAKREALPAVPVLDRIEQGLSKGVPAERIRAASDRLVQKLMEARPAVDGLIRAGMKAGRSAERDAAIASAARALEQNMTKRDIESVGAAVRGKKGSLAVFTGAVDTAAYFTGVGMSPGTAAHLVTNAVQKGYSTHDLDSLIKRMDSEMKRGLKADEVAAKMEREGMESERDRDRQEMQQEMKGGHGPGGGPSGMGGMGGRGR